MALVVVDANLLIYAFDRTAVAYPAARRWMEGVLSSSDILGVPMLAVASLLRASTHPSLDHLRERLEDAVGYVDDLLAMPNVRLLHTDEAHWPELKRVLEESGMVGRSIMDAELAALALRHDGVFCSTDKLFRRFPRLRWVNPIERETK